MVAVPPSLFPASVYPAPRRRVPRLVLQGAPQVSIAAGREQLMAAYRLVYQRYAARGFVRGSAPRLVYSTEFALGDSRTLVALGPQGRVSATATFLGQTGDHDRQSNTVIPWGTIGEAGNQRRFAGVTCLAAEQACDASPMAFFAVARFLFQYARFRGYDGLVLAIHPRQLRFYQRISPIVPLSGVYRQPKLGNSLAVACRIDLDDASLLRVSPRVLAWFQTPIPARDLNQPGISHQDNAFLTDCADIEDYTAPCGETAAVAAMG